MKATDSQPHTVPGFVSILGSKGGEKVESSNNAAGERTYKIAFLSVAVAFLSYFFLHFFLHFFLDSMVAFW